MRLLAYLDPGSGSMLLQVLLGGVAGIAVSIKMFGKRIFSIFTFWKKDEDKSVATPVTASATGEHEAVTEASRKESA